ncbi:MAG: DNA-formamidopyrimidine glycosylase family protein [Egibacteraceae bacterium]
MPELPEVQAHAERLTATFAGLELTGFDALTFTVLKTYAPPAEAPLGRELQQVGRRGKHLLLALGDLTYVVHLMQGGRLRVGPAGDGRGRPRGGRRGAQPVARWSFADGRALLLTGAGSERRAGVWMVAGDPLAAEPLADLGPEADDIDGPETAALLQTHSMRLHTFLRKQQVIAGLGRRLANEVCHTAQLSPFAPTGRLAGDAGRLVEAVRACVTQSLAVERARDDMSASKERPGAVHGRAGQPCPACQDTVRAVEYRGYTVSYCATCQTGGKVLADNTTSKFLT